MKRSKVCPIDQTKFEATRASQVYCSDACRDEAKRKSKRVVTLRSPEEIAEGQLERKVLSLEAAKIAANRERDAVKHTLREVQRERDDLADALSAFGAELHEKPDWLEPSRRDRKKHYGTLVGVFSDLHAGEVVRPAEMGGYNKYDMLVAEKRTERFFARTAILAERYMKGVELDGVVLALGGDLVSGNIHDELVETNECSTYESILETVPWIVKGVEMWLTEFKKVHIVSAPGNHGRDSKKPRHKRRSAFNADTMIAWLVARELRSANNVTFDVPESTDVDFPIYSDVFSLEHGDNMRFSGVSEIGAIGPVKRGSLRKTKKRQEQGRPVRYNIFGHFHQYVPAYTQGFVMNGSVKGYDEFANDWNFVPELPQQALFVVTPEHSITTQMPVFVADRRAEGW